MSKFISQLLYSKRCHILLLGSLVWNSEVNWQAASAECLAKYYCKILPVQKLHSFTDCYVPLWVNQRGTNFWSFASEEKQDWHVSIALWGTIMLLCCCCLFQPLGLVFLQWYFSMSCSQLRKQNYWKHLHYIVSCKVFWNRHRTKESSASHLGLNVANAAGAPQNYTTYPSVFWRAMQLKSIPTISQYNTGCTIWYLNICELCANYWDLVTLLLKQGMSWKHRSIFQ